MQSTEAVFSQAREFTPLQQMTCRYFALGACKYGDACRYAHSKPIRKVPDEEFEALKINNEPVSDSRQRIPCKFFVWGHCKRGQACSFAHAATPDYSQPANEDFEVRITSLAVHRVMK